MRYLLYFICLTLLSHYGFAKNGPDSTESLLLNQKIQIEATQALNDMYNFKFDRAEMQFRWIKQKYDWHPLPYFLLGLSQWWKIVPDLDNKEYDHLFEAYMDTSLVLSEKLYETNPVEGAFFLAATYGFVARLDSDRGNWARAALAGKNALKYVDIVRENVDFSPEILFGDAIMNYYTEWIREEYPVLKPIMWFFPRGDRQKGIEQLQEVAHNAFYTRTEAQYYLIRILANEENRLIESLSIVIYLREVYPDNAYFHRFYISLLYRLGRYAALEGESKEVLARIDSGQAGYEGVSGRYAAYYLGRINQQRNMIDEAIHYYKKAAEFARNTNDQSAWYSISSNLRLGEIYSSSDQAMAKECLENVIEHADDKKHRRQAKKMIREMKRS